MRIFNISKNIQIVAEFKPTRSGFKHEATLLIDGREVDSAKVNYLNRTWESYEYQTVIQKLIDKSDALSSQMKKDLMDWSKKDHTDWSQFRMTAQVAKLGEVFAKDKGEKVKWKERMLKAGLNIELPEDWDTLSDEEKEKRLDKVIELAQSAGKKPSLLKSKKAQMPLTMTKVPKLGSKGSGWFREPVSHSYARKNGKAPKRVRGR